jgi:exopolysaccharide biosynthesis polyprenyl glycosylphosphotransferase
MLFFGNALAAALFAAVTVPAVGAIQGYAGAPLGSGAAYRSILRLGTAGIVCGWFSSMEAAWAHSAIDPNAIYGLWLATTAAWVAYRFAVRRLERSHPERVVIIGGGEVATRLVDLVERHAGGRLDVVGFIDDDPTHVDLPGRPPLLGPHARLKELVVNRWVDRVIVGFSSNPDAHTLELLRACDDFGVQVDIVPRMYEILGTEPRSYALGGLPIMTVSARGGRSIQKAAKRALDVAGALALLLVTSPVLAAIALAIKLEDRGPVLYRQQRIGQGGRAFRILKFRSMVPDADQLDFVVRREVETGSISIDEAVTALKAERDPRITRVGDFARRTSLDELPQLWNVLRGEMSLVGPRPLRAFEVEELDEWEHARHLERPGITGLWQITGRSNVSWQERMHLDYSYVRHWNLAQDLEILARTIPAVVKRDGAR